MKKILLALMGLSVILLADLSRSDAGVVTDSVTGLQWQDDYRDNNDSIKQAAWEQAIAYCEDLELAGKNDWRLPNYNELYSIVDRSIQAPTISPAFQAVVADHYWSSTTACSYGTSAWYVRFRTYDTSYDDDTSYRKFRSHYVRCVRAGE